MATAIEPAERRKPRGTYEVVNGEIVGARPMSFYAGEIANRLNAELTFYGRQCGLGRPRMDAAFVLPLPEDKTRNRKPDVAFVTFERWPEDRPLPFRGNAIDVVPDLAVEVVSPTDRADAVIQKALEYLRAGARLVWVIFPSVRQLYAYHDRTQPPRVFSEGEALEAPDVLPGFSVPLALLFPPLAGPLPPTANGQ